jgi:gamma-glutamyltranspeptidase/glutathione hydrolase
MACLCAGIQLFIPAWSVAASLEQELPEIASKQADKALQQFSRQAVVSAHALASAAGYSMLLQGGNAIDAAIATALALNVVEPQSSGIGGGGFMVLYDGQQVITYDGRETAPAHADQNLFISQGKPLEFAQAVASGRSVGAPGLIPMLEMAHRNHGQLAWHQLFEPAIQLAEKGFAVSQRLNHLLQADPALRNNPWARQLFYQPDGSALAVGSWLRNPELAWVLKQIAQQGSAAIQQGPVAESITMAVQQAPALPGLLDQQDLRNYQPIQRKPLCFTWHPSDPNTIICGAPPPASGTLALAEITGVLNFLSPADNPPLSPQWMHNYIESSRLALADRAQYVADPAFLQHSLPNWESFFSPAYLQSRARHVGARRAASVQPGQPDPSWQTGWANMPDQPEHGTSHLSVIDKTGKAVALTTSIESAFGSRIMVNTGQGRPGGFLLNNQLTDFSFMPFDSQHRLVANRVEPGKRPRSSMTPVLVIDPTASSENRVKAVAGSPGGPFIIHFVELSLWSMLNWQFNPQQAAAMFKFGILSTDGAVLLENKGIPDSWQAQLEQLGHSIRKTELTSGLHLLVRSPQGWLAGTDPRREGLAVGD